MKVLEEQNLEQQNNVTIIEQDGKEFILIGTAHVSKHSANEVKEVIDREKPYSVCIELDQQRYQTMMEGNKWQDTDIFKIIKDKKATLLLMNLAISSFQKRIAKQFDIQAGQEMLQGIKSAEENGAQLVLADRNIQITFSRIWNGIGVKGKVMLLTSVLGGIFSNETITEEDLEKMKEQDSIDSILSEFTEHFPELKQPLVDERDQYLAEKIKRAPGKKVVAVLGAAHIPGVIEELRNEHDLKQLNKVPPKSKWPKRIGWIVPISIISMILVTFYLDSSTGVQQTYSWLLWNGSLAAIGTIVALGHPLAILTAFIAAPITSLNPFMAAGFFAGFVQAYFKKPQVSDFERLNEDVQSVKGFWQNKVTRVLLVILLANLGSAIGTVIAGTDIIRLFINMLT